MQSSGAEFKIKFRKRLYEWTLELIVFIDKLPRGVSSEVMAKQLMRSGTSILANFVEAQAASSRKDFINFLNHALKSANESVVWLELLSDTGKVEKASAKRLSVELGELAGVLGKSISTLKKS